MEYLIFGFWCAVVAGTITLMKYKWEWARNMNIFLLVLLAFAIDFISFFALLIPLAVIAESLGYK